MRKCGSHVMPSYGVLVQNFDSVFKIRVQDGVVCVVGGVVRLSARRSGSGTGYWAKVALLSGAWPGS